MYVYARARVRTSVVSQLSCIRARARAVSQLMCMRVCVCVCTSGVSRLRRSCMHWIDKTHARTSTHMYTDSAAPLVRLYIYLLHTCTYIHTCWQDSTASLGRPCIYLLYTHMHTYIHKCTHTYPHTYTYWQVKKGTTGATMYALITYVFPILSAKAVPDLQTWAKEWSELCVYVCVQVVWYVCVYMNVCACL